MAHTQFCPAITFFKGIQIINASTLPITAVISCVTENVVWNTAIFGTIASGSRDGIRTSAITTPINNAFTMLPAAIPTIRPALPLIFFAIRLTATTRMIFPIITHGMIAGIADMIGLPVIRNDVTGVITDKMIPHAIPAPSAAMIRHALMIGPVMYTLVFLKNWLTIQIASNTAVVVICFVVILINPPCFAEQNACYAAFA